ncbi:hypothetical protein CEXT_189531 [Caerostris extrusa]|uniref:Uncharacterized protein n=1 Tax=Caerostris extrusa TaxID=172846 RepID=A0AAV4X2B9_CAEEX|nr:hypothetical protein CEXT_189531 [Caerostris extrusa]
MRLYYVVRFSSGQRLFAFENTASERNIRHIAARLLNHVFDFLTFKNMFLSCGSSNLDQSQHPCVMEEEMSSFSGRHPGSNPNGSLQTIEVHIPNSAHIAVEPKILVKNEGHMVTRGTSILTAVSLHHFISPSKPSFEKLTENRARRKVKQKRNSSFIKASFILLLSDLLNFEIVCVVSHCYRLRAAGSMAFFWSGTHALGYREDGHRCMKFFFECNSDQRRSWRLTPRRRHEAEQTNVSCS